MTTAPFLTSPQVSGAIYAAGSLICHQRPERSFHVNGAQLPVCARCMGLYVGGLLGVFVWAWIAGVGSTPALRVRAFTASTRFRTLLIVAAIPTVFSLATALAGLWDPGNARRAVLALPLGLVIGVVVTAVAARDLR